MNDKCAFQEEYKLLFYIKDKRGKIKMMKFTEVTLTLSYSKAIQGTPAIIITNFNYAKPMPCNIPW